MPPTRQSLGESSTRLLGRSTYTGIVAALEIIFYSTFVGVFIIRLANEIEIGSERHPFYGIDIEYNVYPHTME